MALGKKESSESESIMRKTGTEIEDFEKERLLGKRGSRIDIRKSKRGNAPEEGAGNTELSLSKTWPLL